MMDHTEFVVAHVLPYVYGEGSAAERADVEAHVASCTSCRREVERLTELREAGTAFLSASLHDRSWQQMLDRATRPRSRWLTRASLLALPALAAAAVLVISLRVTMPRSTGEPVTPAAATLNRVTPTMTRLLAVLNDAPLASKQPDAVHRLLTTVANDASPNVRLAALDALQDVPSEVLTNIDLEPAFQRESFMPIRLAMVDLAMRQGSDGSARLLSVAANSDPDPVVRIRARQAVLKLQRERADVRE